MEGGIFEEDRINKPDRLVSVEGARFRWYIVTMLYIVTGLAIGNVWSSLLLLLETSGWTKRVWYSLEWLYCMLVH